jgi:phospholipid transport system substrate-binding protein
VALVVLGAASRAWAGPPTEALKVGADRVVKVLTDPELKGPARIAERRKALRDVTDPIFDWTEMARRALGRHWQHRTDAEREEFVRLFHDLLERNYVSRIESYRGERIVFTGEAIDGDQATVRSKLLAVESRELAIDYRMLRRPDQRWVVYDILIEGVSLVANYRSQFDQVIRTASYEQLVAKLKSPRS